eukprot:m.151136 g.151136  ORF g.151136 m.151136 type:complete len:366 (+) comp17852_c0_seq1:120-1217(+)
MGFPVHTLFCTVVMAHMLRLTEVNALTNLIIDTDMSGDVDDVLAVCIANQMHKRKEINLAAVVHNTGLHEGVGAVSVLNHYYGHDDVRIGAYKGTFGNPHDVPPLAPNRTVAGPYVAGLVKSFPSPIQNYSQVPEALSVYRQTLAEAEDSSVVISSIGFLVNIAALLESGPDNVSSMTGIELVAKKVKLAAVMGGQYPASPTHEWNFGGGCTHKTACPTTPHATSVFLTKWPSNVPLVFNGFEVGVMFQTGEPLLHANSTCRAATSTNPCGAAIRFYSNWHPTALATGRYSWDPSTTLFAARGPLDFYSVHATGMNTENADTGANAWTNSTQPPGGEGKQAYLILKDGAADNVADAINELLCMPP